MKGGKKIPSWGALYEFGRAKSYQIVARGEGPKTITVGTKIITAEADEQWRQRKLAEAEQQPARPQAAGPVPRTSGRSSRTPRGS